jgi:N-acetyl-1-D-myo-inositol-2-amino-2-deoxy-alpha-D-glucopyranoside deacetylase
VQSTNERVLFVHAHPDDESITTGGTIATLIDRGASVTVLTCTRGELGEVIPADLKHLEGAGELLAAERTTELERAMAALGVTDHRFLGAANARWRDLEPRRYTDSGMVWGATGPEPLASLTDDSFCGAEFGEVAADLAAVIDLVRPSAVISYDEGGGYGHPDHIRAHQAARHAAAVMAVPFFVVDQDPARSTLRVDVRPVLSRKRDALRAHRTQVVVEGDRFALSSGPSRPIAAVEGFTRRLETGPSAVPWKDQGFGVHIMTYLLAVVVGAVIGGISVVNHQFSPSIGGRAIPVGITVVLLIVAALLAGLRMVFPGRLVVGCAAAGLLGVITLLSLASDGGSVLVPANGPGYFLTYGPLALTVIALAWPAAGTFSRDRLVAKL